MKNLSKILPGIFLICIALTEGRAQQDSIRKYTALGKEHFRAHRYYEAIRAFRLVKTFDGLRADNDLDIWIEKSFDGYVVLLKDAEEKSNRLARASELAGEAYKLAKLNPTHALRIAEYAVQTDPGSRSAVQQLHDIASSFPSPFFSTEVQTANEKNFTLASCISPDEQYFLTGNSQYLIQLWDIRGKLIRTFEGHQDKITGLDFFPDGKTFVSASMDNTLKIWSLEGTLLHTLTGHEADVVAAKVSPDGRMIASASWDKSIRLWGPAGESLLKIENAHDDFLTDLDFSPDGRFIVSASWDKQAKLWKSTGEPVQTFKGHQAPVTSVCFSPDGNQIFTGSWDQTAKLWDLKGTVVMTFGELTGQQSVINRVAFHPNNRYVFTAGDDNAIRLWDQKGGLLQTYKSSLSYINALHCSKKGNYLVSSAVNRTAIWPVLGNLVASVTTDSLPIRAVAVSPDEKYIALGLKNGSIWLMDGHGKLIKRINAHDGQGVTSLAFSASGDRFASGSQSDFASIWDLEGNLLHRLKNAGGDVNTVAWSPDDKIVALAGWGEQVILWNPVDSTVNMLKDDGGNRHFYNIDFSPDGKNLVSAMSSGNVILWEIASGAKTVIKAHAPEYAIGAAFSPDGKMIATAGGDNMVRLWDRAGRLLAAMEGHTGRVKRVIFSPDGQYLLSASIDQTVKLWRLDGAEIQSFYGHKGLVNDIVFSSDGSLVWSAGEDRTLQCWKTLTAYLRSEDITALKGWEKKKYGLFCEKTEDISEPASPEFSLIDKDDDLYIQKREKQILKAGDRNQYLFVGQGYSRKAWRSSCAKEQVAYQQNSIARLEKAVALQGKSSPQTNTMRAYFYANLSLWLYADQHTREALEAVQKTAGIEVEPHMRPLFNAKAALLHYLNYNDPESLAVIEASKNALLTKEQSFPDLRGLVTGVVDRKDFTVGELILEDIKILDSGGPQPAHMEALKKLLMTRS